MDLPQHLLEQLLALQSADGAVEIVDVGASNVSKRELPSYTNLLTSGIGRLTAFEPNKAEYQKLESNETRRYLPYAIGSGGRAALSITRSPGFCSTLSPNEKVTSQIIGFSKLSKVTSRIELETHRLDDLQEISRIDFLKIDIQGGELEAFAGAREKLRNCLCVQTETAFVPIYEGQPLFADQDRFLQSMGLQFFAFASVHRFAYEGTPRRYQRRLSRTDLLQWVDADAIYLRDFTSWENLETSELRRLFLILLLSFRAASACLRLGQILVGRGGISTDLLDQLKSHLLPD
ncbi:FkbM family methyltransferase [Rhodobacter sp. SY28-1]|uniref:FkbM family methyltransferase n=1 Tax=Rhodobacter sp. SY28-1 TaxID=2562317 RepID=UPI0010C1348D